jgi:hypothetical protein
MKGGRNSLSDNVAKRDLAKWEKPVEHVSTFVTGARCSSGVRFGIGEKKNRWIWKGERC